MGLLPDFLGRRNKQFVEEASKRDQHNAETIAALVEQTTQLQHEVDTLSQQLAVMKQTEADSVQSKQDMKQCYDGAIDRLDRLKEVEKELELYKRIVSDLMSIHEPPVSSCIARVMMTPENLRQMVYILTQFPKWQAWLGFTKKAESEEVSPKSEEVFLTKEVALTSDTAIQTVFAASEITDDFLHNDTSEPNF